MEPSVHTNLTGGNNAKSSAAPSQASTTTIVNTMKVRDSGTGKYYLKAVHHGCAFWKSSRGGSDFYWKCEFYDCSATMKTEYNDDKHYFRYDKPHDEQVHMQMFHRLYEKSSLKACPPNEDSERKRDSSAVEPPATVSGDAQVPAKKCKTCHLSIGGAVMASDTPHSQDTPPGKAEDAAADNSKIESTKGSGAGNLVDSRAAAVRPSPIHVQHPRGSNEPGTSAWPSDDQGAQVNKSLPPPIPPANSADTAQNDADDGDESSILFDDSINEDGEADGMGSLDPPPQNASYESTSNAENAADDSAGIPLSMHGLGERELREMCLRQKLDLSAKQLEIEDLRAKLLNWELYSNRAGKLN